MTTQRGMNKLLHHSCHVTTGKGYRLKYHYNENVFLSLQSSSYRRRYATTVDTSSPEAQELLKAVNAKEMK